MRKSPIIASLAAAVTLTLAATLSGASASGAKAPSVATMESLLSRGDRAAMRTAASLHLLAIQAANADAAFATISPTTRNRYASAQEFLAVTTSVHGAVRSAKEIVFDGIATVDGVPTVRIYFRDDARRQWLAQFGMSRIAANDWRIVSCSLTLAPGKLI